MSTLIIGIVCTVINLVCFAANTATSNYTGICINIIGLIFSVVCIITGIGGLS